MPVLRRNSINALSDWSMTLSIDKHDKIIACTSLVWSTVCNGFYWKSFCIHKSINNFTKLRIYALPTYRYNGGFLRTRQKKNAEMFEVDADNTKAWLGHKVTVVSKTNEICRHKTWEDGEMKKHWCLDTLVKYLFVTNKVTWIKKANIIYLQKKTWSWLVFKRQHC